MAACAVLGVFLAFSPELYSQGRPLWLTSALVLFFAGGSVVLAIASYKMWMQNANELWWTIAGLLVYVLAGIVLYYLRQSDNPDAARVGYVAPPMTPSTAREEDDGGGEKADPSPDEKQ